MTKKPIVIVGTGLSGYSLAKEYRKLDKESPVLIITADDGISYSKPMLSNGIAKGKDADGLAMADPGKMADQLQIDIRTFTPVTEIDIDKNLVFAGQEPIEYSQLVLALGADVIRLKLQGNGLDQVYSVNDLIDYRNFRNAIKGKQRLAILGAGLIGCEFANDFRLEGLDIDIIAPSDTVLPGLLPTSAADALRRGLEKEGVRFHLGRFATKVDKTEGAMKIELDNGEQLDADLVLSAVGLQPRTELAKNAGITCGKGISVDRSLVTSIENVYALGDCAEVDGHSLLYVLPLMACARALAKTLSGDPTDVSYGVMPVIVKTPACPVAVCPPPTKAAGDWQIHEESALDVRAKFIADSGELLGFALTGKAVLEKQALAKQMPPIHPD